MYLTLVLLPFLGSAVAGFRGRALGATGAQLVATLSVVGSALLALVAFYEVALCRSPVTVHVGSWLSADNLYAAWAFTYDDLTVAMLLPVLVVSSCVHVYSMSYMEADPHTQRFFAWLALFTASMVLLVAGDSYVTLFLGWELIGVASYGLIGFWLTRVQAQKSAVKAMTVNRMGDTVLSLGLFTLFWALGTLEHATVLASAPLVSETVATFVCFLLLGGAMSKSAQVPLHVWLADAMEGPTPVSALIHAATLVTAGVYLMLRSAPLLEYAPTALVFIAWLGATTALFAATCGLVSNDAKRVIAFSTCSQLGYMFMALGLAQYSAALLHLVTHAAFKALLFMGAGSVLHAVGDQQDLRRLGGLVAFLPLTYAAMLVGTLSLIAVPGMTGHASKDSILELAAGTYTLSGAVVYTIGTLSAGVTAFYSLRLATLVFMATPNAPASTYTHAHDAPALLAAPLVFLSILAVVFGYVAKDLWLGLGTDFLASAWHALPASASGVEAEFGVATFVKLLPALVTFVGAASAVYLYGEAQPTLVRLADSTPWRRVYTFLVRQWGFNSLMANVVIRPALALGLIASKVLDRGLVETVGPHGLSTLLPATGKLVARYDTSLVTTYALYVMLGLLGMVTVLFAPVLTGYVGDASLVLVYLCTLTLLPAQD